MESFINEESLQNNFGNQLLAFGWKEIKFSSLSRTSSDEVFLTEILQSQISKLNPQIKPNILEEALKEITIDNYRSLFDANHGFYKKITDGIFIEDYTAKDKNPCVKIIDFENINNNIFTFVHEYTITQQDFTKRADTILFVNGLPLILVEFKSPVNKHITIENAHQQIQNYKHNVPNLFLYNLFCIITDGATARIGTHTASFERFQIWKKRNIDDNISQKGEGKQLDILIEGLLNKYTLLDILKNYTVYTTENEKIIPAYHQYYGVKKAIKSIQQTTDGRAGVIWHTQGSGKSLSMVFLARQVIDTIKTATIIVITDRNNLDEQLHHTFSKTFEYLKLPHHPYHVDSYQDLIATLKDKTQGDIIFTTIQKFNDNIPLLSARKNIIVIADEAHRSQYGIEGVFLTNDETKEMYEHFGYAKYMRIALPNAIFIGFTGTPIENKDKSIYKIFGKNIDTYDMLQSVRDGNTVPIKYEAQLIKVKYDESLIGKIYYEGKTFNQISEFIAFNQKKIGQTIVDKTTDELIKLSTIIGDKDRIKSLVKLFIKHYNNRKDQLYGKAMYVAYSREIAFQVYKEITSNKEFAHQVKLIVTNDSQDGQNMSFVVGTKKQRNEWIKEFKDKNSRLKIIIVVDMLLTGFDVPFLDVMYIDKPLRMHNLMQAIARVNRTYQDDIVKKDFGLIVDFIGLGKYLNEAIAAYTIAVNSECTVQWIETVIDHLKDEYEGLCNMFHKFDFSNFVSSNSSERYTIIQKAYEYILEQDANKNEQEKAFLNNFMKRAKAIEEGFKYAINKLELEFRTKLAFFIALRAFANKNIYNKSIIGAKNFKNALRDILESAIVTKQLVTISNLDNENQIDILNPESVEKLIKDYPPRTLVEMIINWLKKEINLLSSRNIVKSNFFQEKLLTIIDSYNKISDPESMLHSVIQLAKEINESKQKGMELGLTPEEEAFYDALCKPENIKREYDKKILIDMAKELLKNVNSNATVDWYQRKDVKAKMRTEIRLLLNKYQYPPAHYKDAVELIINQAEKHANKNIAYK